MNLDASCVVEGLHFPTSLTFDSEGVLYVAGSGLPFDGAPGGGQIWRIDEAGKRALLIEGLRCPLNGITWHEGALLIAEGGNPGRLSKFDLVTGAWSCILDGLPGGGNYHTNTVIPGPDDKLYFGQGAATNSGIVGPDANHLSWLRRLPHPHDIPGSDVVLTGANVLLNGEENVAASETGAFMPYGTPAQAGQKIAGTLPCTAAVMRCNPNGTALELVAWGLRNPYGLGFLENGRLLAVDLGMNDRGSRPLGNVPDCIYEVIEGCWYGWPDFVAGELATNTRYQSNRPAGRGVEILLANHNTLGLPPEPLVTFPVHAAPTRFAVHPDGVHLCVAMFGDKRPFTGVAGPKAGRCLAIIDATDGTIVHMHALPLHRPIDLAFHPITGELFIVDFGNYEMGPEGELYAKAATGGVWCVGTLKVKS